MKTKFNLIRSIALAASVAFMTVVGTTAKAADDTKPMKPMKGAEHLLMLGKVDTKAHADALKTGDTVAMVCAKCKNVAVTRVEKQRGREFLVPGTKHGCAGCGSEIEVVRMGDHGIDKQKHETVKHVCKSCGDDSAFCCATKSGSATKGMEKK